MKIKGNWKEVQYAMKKKCKKVVKVAMREATLKRKLRAHLRAIGFRKTSNGSLCMEGSGKEIIRTLHSSQREDKLKISREFIDIQSQKLLKYFASGNDINPAKISPVLVRVKAGTWQGDLFRFAALTWSVPVSNGFGRRLRYLVWDNHNEKLIGLIAIGDPVFNLAVRDKFIGWNAQERGTRLVNLLDAYVLGALPPYNELLGGKLVACLLRSRDIYNDFYNTYGKAEGIISKQAKNAHLLVVTTSSSMGRSSVYNRLKLGGEQYFKPIGYTGGWGHFHIPDDLFLDLRNYLRDIGHSYADLNRFGQGPNWKMRTTRAALHNLGFKNDMLRHGIKREVFMCELASNAMDILRSGRGDPDLTTLLTAQEVAQLAVERWILPRAERRPEYKLWKAENIINLLAIQRRVIKPRIEMAN
jgi:hypothetical protein